MHIHFTRRKNEIKCAGFFWFFSETTPPNITADEAIYFAIVAHFLGGHLMRKSVKNPTSSFQMTWRQTLA